MEHNKIVLERLSQKDRDAVAEILTDKEIAKTYMVPDFTCAEQVENLFRRLVTLSVGEERFVRGIYVNNALVGFLNDVGISGGTVELGWVVHPRYHNHGFATEAVRLAIEELFAKGFREVTAGAFEENGAKAEILVIRNNKPQDGQDRGDRIPRSDPSLCLLSY